MTLTREDAFLILNSLPHVGPVTLRRLLESFNGDPVAILAASGRRLESVRDVGPVIARTLSGWSTHVDLEAQREKLRQSGVRFVDCEHEDYPPLLQELYDAPIGLYWKGQALNRMPCVGFVGTRRATLYGTGIAQRLARELAARGLCIVSGMARGIDSAAHRGALEAGGKTLAVLGCGLDIIYPPENYELYQQIAVSGAVISEFPFGRRADRQTFPMRNRIIAGLCRGVVVVESAENGGAMISARFAAEQGRTVFAVPGRIDQDSSRGCHALIREGATLVTSAEEILEELDSSRQLEMLLDEQGARVEREETAQAEVTLDASGKAVLAYIRESATASPEQAAQALGRPVQEVAASLLMLELNRFVGKRADGMYELL